MFKGPNQNIYNYGNIKGHNVLNYTKIMMKLFAKYFPKNRLTSTNTNEKEKHINSLQSKNSSEYDEVSKTILKISTSFR